MVVAAAVEEPPLATPPATPVIGSCYIVGSSPSGAWSGHAQQLAAYTSGGWRFIAPCVGMCAYVASSGSTALYHDGSWEIGTLSGSQVVIEGEQVVGPREPAIADPTAGSIIDAEARAAIGEILTAMRQHGLIEM